MKSADKAPQLNHAQQRAKARILDFYKPLPLAQAIEAAETAGGLNKGFLRDFVLLRRKGAMPPKKEEFKPKYYAKVAKALGWTISEMMWELYKIPTINPKRKADIKTVDPLPAFIPELHLRQAVAFLRVVGDEEANAHQAKKPSSDTAILAHWGIPMPFLREQSNPKADRLVIMRIDGNAMVGIFYDGDRVAVDLDRTDASAGGYFAIVTETAREPIVRQIELIEGDGAIPRIMVVATNQTYKPREMALIDPVRIIGRVTYRITARLD